MAVTRIRGVYPPPYGLPSAMNVAVAKWNVVPLHNSSVRLFLQDSITTQHCTLSHSNPPCYAHGLRSEELWKPQPALREGGGDVVQLSLQYPPAHICA